MPRIAFPVAVIVPILMAIFVLAGLWKFGGEFSQARHMNQQSEERELAFAQAVEAGKVDLSSEHGTATVKAVLLAAAASRKLGEGYLCLYTSLSWAIGGSVLAHVFFCLAARGKRKRTAVGDSAIAP